MKTQRHPFARFRAFAQHRQGMWTFSVASVTGALAIVAGWTCIGSAHAEPAVVLNQLSMRFHLNALQESPLRTFRATLLDGNPIADNVFTNLSPIDGQGQFASVAGQRSFAVRLRRDDGLQNAFVIWTATDRRCAATFNTVAAQNASGGIAGREYEISSLVVSSTSSAPVKSFSRRFCAPENARFDVTFNAAGPKAIPVVISALSAADDSNVLNRFVWFLVI